VVQPAQAASRNRILSALTAEDYSLLQPHLEFAQFELRQVFEKPNEVIEHVHFMERGMASVVADGTRNRRIEVGMIGWEGMSGVTVILGNHQSPNETFIQVAGSGLSMLSAELRGAMRTSPALHALLLRYAQAFMTQTAHTALANGRAKINERLARWLLMAHDRADGDEIPLVHEFLALMLGVRREGVTVALQRLEGAALIRAKRGLIVIRNRKGLERCADGLYGVPEAELDRLLA
jgi:CRP-like cAMP-binding protein